ncbi:MAG: hypothetical protein ACR2NZ_19365 [Rubripirellula sp.]
MVRTLVFLLVAGACITAKPMLAAELTDAKCSQLLTELEPGREEVWRTIPWKLAVLDAQRIASEEDKPIFIWAMDGHPLGCT